MRIPQASKFSKKCEILYVLIFCTHRSSFNIKIPLKKIHLGLFYACQSRKTMENNRTSLIMFHFLPSIFSSVQSLSCVRLCDPMNRRTPGLPVHHQLLEFTHTHVHRVGDAIQPSHPLSSALSIKEDHACKCALPCG